MAVTQEQIFAAADQIAAEGRRPTQAAIRDITGGSYTTISPALNAWKERQKAAAAPAQEPAPTALGERMAELAAEIWSQAMELATRRLAAEREALEQARLDIEAAQAESAELADQLSAEIDQARTTIAAHEQALADARTEADALRQELGNLRAQGAVAQARVEEMRAELERAHQANAETQRERDQARRDGQEEAQALREKLALASERADTLDARLAQRDAELERAQQASTEARQELDQARQDAAELKGRLTAHQEQINALLARIQPEGKARRPGRGRAEA